MRLPSGMRFDSDRTVVPLSDHERLPGGFVVDPLSTEPGRLGPPSDAGRDALPLASTEAGGVVTTADFRGSCSWPPSSAMSCTRAGRTEADRLSVDVLDEDGQPRFIWDDLCLTRAGHTEVLVASVMERRRWRARYDTAKQAALEREEPSVDNRSATIINAAVNVV